PRFHDLDSVCELAQHQFALRGVDIIASVWSGSLAKCDPSEPSRSKESAQRGDTASHKRPARYVLHFSLRIRPKRLLRAPAAARCPRGRRPANTILTYCHLYDSCQST